jgi:hypothetical protein
LHGERVDSLIKRAKLFNNPFHHPWAHWDDHKRMRMGDIDEDGGGEAVVALNGEEGGELLGTMFG